MDLVSSVTVPTTDTFCARADAATHSKNTAVNSDLSEVRTTLPPLEDPSGRQLLGTRWGDSSAVQQSEQRILCPDKKVAFTPVRELNWPRNSHREGFLA